MNTKTALTKFSTIIALTASLTLGSAISPASAAQIGTNSTSYSQSDLEDKGYSCEVVSLGFVECTKGDTTYWCSGGTCTKKKKTSRGIRPTNVNESATVFTSSYTPISITKPQSRVRGNMRLIKIAQ